MPNNNIIFHLISNQEIMTLRILIKAYIDNDEPDLSEGLELLENIRNSADIHLEDIAQWIKK